MMNEWMNGVGTHLVLDILDEVILDLQHFVILGRDSVIGLDGSILSYHHDQLKYVLNEGKEKILQLLIVHGEFILLFLVIVVVVVRVYGVKNYVQDRVQMIKGKTLETLNAHDPLLFLQLLNKSCRDLNKYVSWTFKFSADLQCL